MAFSPFYPFVDLAPRSANTSNSLSSQVWQELVMLRHFETESEGGLRWGIVPWIDQGKAYFQDAVRSNWRSAGLLYYYSFLNLAKAYLGWKKKYSIDDLNKISIHHGLSSKPQEFSNLINYEIGILPPQYQGRSNIFSALFETITAQAWPFADVQKISLGSISGYCRDIGAELKSLYGIENRIIEIESLTRFENSNSWIEMNVHESKANILKEDVSPWTLSELIPSNMDRNDERDWLFCFHRTKDTFIKTKFLRGPKQRFTSSNMNAIGKKVISEALKHLMPFAIPTVQDIQVRPYWLFLPKINLNGKNVRWHPLLSDYLFAFVLSTILRYHPEVLEIDNKDYFLAEAWSNQSPITTLRYFLMLFTDPPLRINTI